MFNTDDILSTKFGTNVLNNIDKPSQTDWAQLYIPAEKRDLSNIIQKEGNIIPQINQEKEETNFNFEK